MKTQVEGLNTPVKNKLSVQSPFDLPTSKDVYDPEYKKEMSKIPPDYYSLKTSLASQFLFYNFDDLHIRPLNSSEVILLNLAHTTNSLRPIAQVINGTLYEDINCLAMTYTDVKQLMAWLRLNSYHKHDFSYTTNCYNEEHYKKVVSGELTVESLVNDVITNASDFKEELINADSAHASFEQIKREYDLELVPETFGMHIELRELLEELAPKDEDGKLLVDKIVGKDANYLFTANYAKYLSPMYGDTLQEKIDFFSSLKLSPDIYLDIQKFVEATQHGFQEILTTNCRGCGAPIVTNVTFEPRSFFP